MSNRAIGILIVTLAVLSCFVVAALLPGPGFVSGDNGTKAVVAQHLSRGGTWPYQPDWIDEIPAPFRPLTHDFTVTVDGRHVPVFPPYFSFVGAVVHWLFGFWGLVIPAFVGVLCSWVVVTWHITAKTELDRPSVILLVLGLTFGSGLPVYAVLAWEHGVAVGLVSASMGLALTGSSRRAWFLAGLVGGLSVWFREETGIILALLPLWLRYGISSAGPAGRSGFKPSYYWGGLLAAGVGLLLANEAFLGHPFGARALHLVSDANRTQDSHVVRVADNFLSLVTDFLVFSFPPIIVLVLAAFRRPTRRAALSTLGLVGACVLAISITAPTDGGRQWGARFLLPLIPLGFLALSQVLSATPAPLRHRVRAALAGCILLAVVQNTVFGTMWLVEKRWAHENTRRFLEQIPSEEWILMREGYVAQEHMYHFPDRVFVVINRSLFFATQHQLGTVAGAIGRDSYVWMCGVWQPCDPGKITDLEAAGYEHQDLGIHGYFHAYRLTRGLPDGRVSLTTLD